MKVLIGISGGIDSAYLLSTLVDRYHVKAIFLRTGFNSHLEKKVGVICERFGVDYEIVDAEEVFREVIVERFLRFYAKGLTPNPCVWCNPEFKFKFLLEIADKEGFNKVATGHYARVFVKDNQYFLAKARDEKKDQSYFLYRVLPVIDRVLLPLGEVKKENVRERMAKIFGPNFFSCESQDLCFIHHSDYRRFVANKISVKSGLIVDIYGQVLGYHSGVHNFTVGQRHGLGISRPGPWYVTKVDPRSGLVVVAKGEDSKALSCRCVDVIRIFDEEEIEATAKIRYNQPNIGVKVRMLSEREMEVVFNTPQRGVAKGQHVVLYRDSIVIGGGQISRVFYPWGE